jgi:hypothetical protein
MSTTRVLALDHFFDQDLRALEANPRLQVRRFPYQRLRGRAVRLMGQQVGRGLHAYNDPGNTAARARYAAWLAHEVERKYLERAFDIIVLPSDTFFYVRTLPAAAHRLGVPVVVVQKETSISEATMQTFSLEIGTEAPFVSDLMTVCSERQRDFWQRAGAAPERIEVTGQPRFDIYASPPEPRAQSRRRVVYLTYTLDAYVPGAGRGKGLRTWESLRDTTESTLMDQVGRGECDLIVKCHPQQDRRAEAARLARLAGSDWGRGVTIADEGADTRELILGADVVVGFQTTALYEAVAARRTAVYAAWGEEYERYRDGLIPFDAAPPDCVHHATSPEMLATMIGNDSAGGHPHCIGWSEQALGSLDGHATERVARRLEAFAAAWTPTERRRELDSRRRRFAVGYLARSIAAETVWTAAIPAAVVASQQGRVTVRRQRAREGRATAVATLRHGKTAGGS